MLQNDQPSHIIILRRITSIHVHPINNIHKSNQDCCRSAPQSVRNQPLHQPLCHRHQRHNTPPTNSAAANTALSDHEQKYNEQNNSFWNISLSGSIFNKYRVKRYKSKRHFYTSENLCLFRRGVLGLYQTLHIPRYFCIHS